MWEQLFKNNLTGDLVNVFSLFNLCLGCEASSFESLRLEQPVLSFVHPSSIGVKGGVPM